MRTPIKHPSSRRGRLAKPVRMADAAATEGLERLRAVVTSYEGTDPEKASNKDFEYGLERVLDGLQARLDGRS